MCTIKLRFFFFGKLMKIFRLLKFILEIEFVDLSIYLFVFISCRDKMYNCYNKIECNRRGKKLI